MTRSEMPINYEILRWARETAGYSLDDISKKQSLTRFAKWENGELRPSYSQLEKIAETLHRPIALFFFPSVPEEETIEKSLRAMSEADVHNLPPNIRQLFRKARAFQISLRELQDNNSIKRIEWLNTLKGSNNKKLTTELRSILKVSLSEQESWKNSPVVT